MCNNIFFSEVRQYIQLPDLLKPEDAFELGRLCKSIHPVETKTEYEIIKSILCLFSAFVSLANSQLLILIYSVQS